MNSQDIRNLQEAYLDVYDEGYKDLGDKARDKGHQLLNKSKKTATRGSIYSGVKPSNTPEGENLKQRASKQFAASAFHNPEKSQAKAAANKEKGEKKKKSFGNRLTRSDGQGIRDSYDLYDIILSHLLDEGYADTQEAALAIMGNMSEDWRESIAENVTSGKSRVRNVQPKPTGPISNSERQSIIQSRIDAENIRIKKAGDEAHATATSKGLGFSDAQARRAAAELRLKREIAKSYR